MNLKQSEPYFHGFLLFSCCAEDYCNCASQLQDFQAIPSSYKPSILNYDVVLAEQKEHQATVTSPFASLRRHDSRLFFPGIYRERPRSCEASRHKVGEERLLPSSVFRNFQKHKSWKIEAGCKPKRKRTIFTADQLERLEKEFDRQQYIVGAQRFFLAADLGLNETQVKVWFQNRRIKWRRQNLYTLKSPEGKALEQEENENL